MKRTETWTLAVGWLSLCAAPAAWSMPQDDALSATASSRPAASRWSAMPALDQCLTSPAAPRLQPQLAPTAMVDVRLAGWQNQPDANNSVVAIPAILSGMPDSPISHSVLQPQSAPAIATDETVPGPGAGNDLANPLVPAVLSGLEPLPSPLVDATPLNPAGTHPGNPAAHAPASAQPFQPLLPAAGNPALLATAPATISGQSSAPANPQRAAALAEVPVPPSLQWFGETETEIGQSFLQQPQNIAANNPVAQPVPVPSILASPLSPLAVPQDLPSVGQNLLTLQAIEPLGTGGQPFLDEVSGTPRIPAGNASLVLGEIQPLGRSNSSPGGPFRLLQLDESKPGAGQDDTKPTRGDKYSVAAMTGGMADPSMLFASTRLEQGYKNQAGVVVTPTRMQVDSYGTISGWAPVSYSWITPAFSHNRLYFEQVNYERYGMTHAAGCEPVVSAAHFYGTVLLMPFRPLCERHCDEVFTLGHQRPGDCAIHQVHADNRLGMGW